MDSAPSAPVRETILRGPPVDTLRKKSPRAAKTGLHVCTRRLYMCVVRSHAQDISDAVFDTGVGRRGYFTAKEAGDVVTYS